MTKKMKFIVLSAMILFLAAGLMAKVFPIKLCCIAGEYKGTNIANQLPNCPVPKSESFTMTIFQSRECSADISGKITSPSGEVNEFKGILSRGFRGCCVINASFSNPSRPGNLVKFTGTFCLRAGKWQAKGTFTETNSGDPCKQGGTWEIKQL